jgi:hypothetical protein
MIVFCVWVVGNGGVFVLIGVFMTVCTGGGILQDTCRIHHDTSGYVSDRKLHPKTIGNPP